MKKFQQRVELNYISGNDARLHYDYLRCERFFDAVIEKHPKIKYPLGLDVNIEHHFCFEGALIKVQANKMVELTYEENEQISIPKNGVSPITKISIKPLSFNEQAIKKRPIAMIPAQETIIDSDFMISTSNIIERLMSNDG